MSFLGQSDFFLKKFLIPPCTLSTTDGLVYLLVSETHYVCTQSALLP
jgi:hypothetical protein